MKKLADGGKLTEKQEKVRPCLPERLPAHGVGPAAEAGRLREGQVVSQCR
jgi:hypothetical protein